MKKKQWEPETRIAYTERQRNGHLCKYAHQIYPRPSGEGDKYNVKVRIIREKDFQRLLKIARKAQTSKRTP